MAASGSINIHGSSNQVSWSPRDEVEIATAGLGDPVSRAR
jgi:hypothetical protein